MEFGFHLLVPLLEESFFKPCFGLVNRRLLLRLHFGQALLVIVVFLLRVHVLLEHGQGLLEAERQLLLAPRVLDGDHFDAGGIRGGYLRLSEVGCGGCEVEALFVENFFEFGLAAEVHLAAALFDCVAVGVREIVCELAVGLEELLFSALDLIPNLLIRHDQSILFLSRLLLLQCLNLDHFPVQIRIYLFLLLDPHLPLLFLEQFPLFNSLQIILVQLDSFLPWILRPQKILFLASFLPCFELFEGVGVHELVLTQVREHVG